MFLGFKLINSFPQGPASPALSFFYLFFSLFRTKWQKWVFPTFQLFQLLEWRLAFVITFAPVCSVGEPCRQSSCSSPPPLGLARCLLCDEWERCKNLWISWAGHWTCVMRAAKQEVTRHSMAHWSHWSPPQGWDLRHQEFLLVTTESAWGSGRLGLVFSGHHMSPLLSSQSTSQCPLPPAPGPLGGFTQSLGNFLSSWSFLSRSHQSACLSAC